MSLIMQHPFPRCTPFIRPPSSPTPRLPHVQRKPRIEVLRGDPWVAEMLAQFMTVRAADKKRHLSVINLHALKAQASLTMNKVCTSADPLFQGGYNTVLLLTFADGTDDVVARVGCTLWDEECDPLSDEEVAYRFRCEVATMAYVKKQTSIPVPRIHHFDGDQNNPVGSRYMLMERVRGPSLLSVWDTMTHQQHLGAVVQVALLERELLRTRFHTGGALIEDGAVDQMCVPSRPELRTVNPPYMGPFISGRDFLAAHVRSSLDSLRKSERRDSEAIKWFELALDGIVALPSTPTAFSLFHDELNMGHVLVSPSNPTKLDDFVRFAQDIKAEGLYGGAVDEAETLIRLRAETLQKAIDLSDKFSLGWLHWVISIHNATRDDRDAIFLEWFQDREQDAEVDNRDITGFLPLKLFVVQASLLPPPHYAAD
ncbi:hypothetical protein DFH07DRAFT_1063783 [Mycena maculata]|uniref:Aminoglycoside phosphotransferase domain-containing protein n=1 Tax=Mycena maculata TaxID=230809 RepID=A0AAD7IH65_9AGAR|nr:hypothetical protein DFH07DRAFT_1063783 [Mycena maculata]